MFKKILASLGRKNLLINMTHGCLSMFRLSRWLCQGNVFVLIFALVQHVAPLCLQWPLAQLFPAA
jgi:hypothetical protein